MQNQTIATRLLVKKARRSFQVFARYVNRQFIGGRHLDLLTTKLEDVEAGRIKRLMVFMPPRHGKSTAISQLFPCWYFGRNPTKDIIQVGFADDISILHSRHARLCFGGQRYSTVFPGVARRIDENEVKRQSVHEWTTLAGGRYKAAGIMSGITGRGANLIVIDDPVKNREEANSPTVRAKIMQEYRSTLYTRLTPDGAIILVMTRWHRDDLAGQLLREMESGGEKWDVLCMPAIADGKALWPERWPLERLQEIKTALGSVEFEAMYQQNPLADGAGSFKREWFSSNIVDQAPADARWCRAWDMASTKLTGGNDPDWTSGALVGLKDGVWYIKDMCRRQATPLETERLIKSIADKDGHPVPIRMEQEGGSGGPITIDHYARYILVGFDFKGDKPKDEKKQRAGIVAASAEAGNVKLVKGPWVSAFLDEVETFPNGAHDDQVDAVSLAFRTLAATPRMMLV